MHVRDRQSIFYWRLWPNSNPRVRAVSHRDEQPVTSYVVTRLMSTNGVQWILTETRRLVGESAVFRRVSRPVSASGELAYLESTDRGLIPYFIKEKHE